MKELFAKISEAMNETLVGNYVFSDEELAQIYEFAGERLRNYNGGLIGYDQLMFVAMVNAVKTWKSEEDTFWDCIGRKLIGVDNFTRIYPQLYNYLTGVIDKLGRHGKIMYLSGCTKRYYATILAHAFAPLNSTESFLELCWNLYSDQSAIIITKSFTRKFIYLR